MLLTPKQTKKRRSPGMEKSCSHCSSSLWDFFFMSHSTHFFLTFVAVGMKNRGEKFSYYFSPFLLIRNPFCLWHSHTYFNVTFSTIFLNSVPFALSPYSTLFIDEINFFSASCCRSTRKKVVISEWLWGTVWCMPLSYHTFFKLFISRFPSAQCWVTVANKTPSKVRSSATL